LQVVIIVTVFPSDIALSKLSRVNHKPRAPP